MKRMARPALPPCLLLSLLNGLAQANPSEPAAPAPSPPERLAEADPPADRAPDRGRSSFPRVTISGRGEDPETYAAPNASIATKTDTPLLVTPMKVEVLTPQILRDLGTTSRGLPEALNSLGIQGTGQGDLGESFFYRGFSSTTTLWNGFRVEDLGTNVNGINGGVWMDNVERLELLRGPSSLLYGRAEPGGALNITTKKPRASFGGHAELGLGSESQRWAALDLGGPLDAEGRLLYRLNASREVQDSWYRHGPAYRSSGIAPALALRLSPQTTLSFEGQFRNLEGSSTQPYMPVDTATQTLLDVDPSRTLMPGAQSSFRQRRVMLGLEHRFDARWSLNARYLYNDATNPLTVLPWIVGMEYPGPLSATATATRGLVANRGFQEGHAAMLDLVGKLRTPGIEHTVLAGFDLYDTKSYQNTNFDCWCIPFDYFKPLPVPKADIPGEHDTWNIDQRELSFYLQDQMKIGSDWHLLLGLRHQRLKERSVYVVPPLDFDGDGVSDYALNEDIPYRQRVTLPRLGLLWQARPGLSLYYSYSENAGASQGLAFPGRSIRPEFSRQHELGAKAEWLDGRLVGSLAVFELNKTHIVAADTAHRGFNLDVGEVNSRGFELHLQGEITPRWKLLAGYNHARPVVKKGTDPAQGSATALQPLAIETGRKLPYFSEHSLSLLSSFQLTPQWRIGGGINAFSAANRDANSALKTRAYSVASAFAAYETRLAGRKSTLQLHVSNLFDEEYLLFQGDVGKVLPEVNFVGGNWGTPRQFRLSLRTEF